MLLRWTLGLGILLPIAFVSPTLSPGSAQAQSATTSPERPPSAGAAPTQTATAPYKAVAITLPGSLDDKDLDAFRTQLIEIAERKDRDALSGLIVSKGYFWERESGEGADPKKSGLANFAAAMGLDNPDDPDTGWDTIAIYAEDPMVFELSDRPGVFCGPADPTFDEDAFQALLDETQTDISDWVYPLADDVELRNEPRSDAPVVEKVGLTFIRVVALDTPSDAENPEAADFVRVALPSGKLGYVMISDVASLGVSQICYTKEGDAWKIAGVLGGE